MLALLAVASAQPFLPGQNLLPAGNLRTTDGSGPNADGSFNLTLLSTQENQLKGEAPLATYQLSIEARTSVHTSCTVSRPWLLFIFQQKIILA